MPSLFPCSPVIREWSWKKISDRKTKQNKKKTSSRHLVNTSWKHLAKISSRHLQEILPRRLQDLFKTSSTRTPKMSSRHLQQVFKTYHQVKSVVVNMSLRRLRDVFNTFLRRTAKTIIYRKTYLGKYMVRVKNFQEWTLWIYWNF